MAKERNLRSDLIADYSKFFNTESGKRVMRDLIRKHHVMTPSYSQTSDRETAFREGQRYVVLNIMRICKLDPNSYGEMIESAKEEYENDARRSTRHIE